MTTFGTLLRFYRYMSQTELARRAGFNAAAICHLEKGKYRPQIKRESVLKLAHALGLSSIDTDRLLIAAGYWPWPDQAEDVERALSAVHGAFYVERILR